MTKLSLTVLLWLLVSIRRHLRVSFDRFQPVAHPILPFAVIRAASTSLP
jgi:hypothetical protein